MKFLTRKQSAVIFRAFKEGKLEMEEYVVKAMYQSLTYDKFGNAPYVNPHNYDSVYNMVAVLEEMIPHIISGEYAKANFLFANRFYL